MLKQLQQAVIASGNSWESFVEAYSYELFQIITESAAPSVALAEVDTVEFSGISVATLTSAADADVVTQNETVRKLNVNNRFYMRTDNRWITFSNNFGPIAENANQGRGTAAEPNVAWAGNGFYIQSGEKIRSLDLLLRRNNAEVTGFDFRLLFHTGAPGSGTWNSAAETTITTLLSVNGFTLAASGWHKFNPTLTEFAAPADGHLIPVFRPTGTITATRYLLTSGIVEVAF